MTKQIVLWVVTTSLVSFAACVPGEADPDTVAEVRLGVELINSELQEAYRAGDADGAVSLMTENVVLMPDKSPNLSGQDAVRGLLQSFFGGSTVSTYELMPEELHVYGETAYELGVYRWASVHGEVDTIVERGRYSAVRKRSADGRWLIHRLLENTMPAGHPAMTPPGG
jgi:ketosteroid isomerase-like protein